MAVNLMVVNITVNQRHVGYEIISIILFLYAKIYNAHLLICLVKLITKICYLVNNKNVIDISKVHTINAKYRLCFS